MPLFTPGSSRSVSPDSFVTTPDNSCCTGLNIDVALRIFEKLAVSSDTADNAAKDVACLIHSMGMVELAIQRLKSVSMNYRAVKVYSALSVQLRGMVGKPIPPISSRLVYVEISATSKRISVDLLRTIFPNIQKVWRVLVSSCGRTCLVEFASHSSARRAVDSRQQPSSHLTYGQTFDSSSVKCAWASSSVAIPPLRIDYLTDFPVFEMVDDDSIVAPSLDWRRPRPRSESIYSNKSHEVGSLPDLMSILKCTGAFDDYPPQLSQLRF
jgi:hypothetical protein